MRKNKSIYDYLFISVIIGFVIVFLSGYVEFTFANLCNAFAIATLFLLPRIFDRYQQQLTIDTPSKHITFTDDTMLIGNDKYLKSEVNTVAIECVEETGYFSLPYNVGAPNFCFPATEYDYFKAYLNKHLPEANFIK